ncbi:hypothetical protein ASA1KI_37470 [Opitutales bacterium ASA1]|uniref:hypothetical protein n=1 Tax=Congregicoccus parvus TaxID=3081749 RepID=UPI002B28AF91|nr:hypothetical protein ASA1KI_37470 [Opitutales bacterium ASA1]
MTRFRHALFALSILAVATAASPSSTAQPIDRAALVARHNPTLAAPDVDAPLTVGNGGFAFTADVTGLQTFSALHQREGVPTETQARWAWIHDENTEGYTLADASRDFMQADGRAAPYPTRSSTPAGDWLRKNPRTMPIGQLELIVDKADGSPLAPADLADVRQSLDMWHGVISSAYSIEGKPVNVTTVAHPEQDAVAVRIESPLAAEGRMRVRLSFPRGYDIDVKNTPGFDWSQPDSHTSALAPLRSGRARISRERLDLRYEVGVRWSGRGAAAERFRVDDVPHTFVLSPAKDDAALEFTVSFARGAEVDPALPTFAETLAASRSHWSAFWAKGGVLDLSGSTDPRAHELERRVVLSQYLTAVQMVGEVPPQESGLTCSTWYGKHHTEMIWWHVAHFALWGHPEFVANALEWYRDHLPAARTLAESRGLRGARWSKMTGPGGRESPGGNPLIIWNQPHPVYLAELIHRTSPTSATLDAWRELVFETAECMATMAHFDEARGTYVLGPPLWIAQEIYDQATSQNPSFELAYWSWALEVAQQWRLRLGIEREPRWDHVIAHLSPVPEKDGLYVALESHPDTWDNMDSRHDHPTMLAPLGLLPGGSVEVAKMHATLDAVLERWDWETKIWGWDYPMIAMTAARLGRPEDAVAVLLHSGPNNAYLPSGHVPQRSDEARPAGAIPEGQRRREIATYLPANGSLLAAVAVMAAGWDGASGDHPGFPKDDAWKVRSEGIRPLP